MGSWIDPNRCYVCNENFEPGRSMCLVKLTTAQKDVNPKAPPMICRQCFDKPTKGFRFIGLYRFVGPVQR